MGAEHPIRRRTTARKLAERMGASPRTIRRIIAEPRDQYEARVTHRRERIAELRRQGWTIAAIATEVGMSIGGVGMALQHLRKNGADLPPQSNRGRKPKPAPETRDTRPENTT